MAPIILLRPGANARDFPRRYQRLAEQGIDNPDQIDLEASIRRMSEAEEVLLPALR